MSWLGDIDALLGDVKAEVVSSGSSLVESGVYLVTVKEAFVRKVDSGATMFHLVGSTNEGLSIDWNTCVKSGDAKGNKPTYVDKKSGKELLLPGVVQVSHLFEALGSDIKTTAPTSGKIKFKDGVIEAGIFKTLTDKAFKACIRQYENEYNGEVNIKYDIENFLDKNGNNKNGENLVDKFLEKIEKSPIKKLKKTEKQIANEMKASSEFDDWK